MTELPDRLLRDALDHTASTAPSAACVDVERLAAWADGAMTNAERAALEGHAAGCARCLALLAAMTRTEPPPIAPPWWRRSRIAWLVPLAAVTAGLVIVVRLAVLEQRSAASLPTAARAVEAPPDLNLTQHAPTPAEPPKTLVASKATAPTRRPTREPVGAEAGRAAPAAREAANDARASTPTATPTATPIPAAPAPAAPAPAASAPAASAPAASASSAPAPAAPVAALAAPAPAPPTGQGAPPALRDRMAGGRGGARTFAGEDALKATAQAVAAAPVVIASPDRDSQWRIVGGTVEHTADGGSTWHPQTIGVLTPMRAGAAPDARVCWLAGTGGVVLRTTDGVTWTRIPFPEAVDLAAIQASDASHAAVRTADGRRFTTSDGGGAWARQ